jgi:tetratricopeptide (TPR) repeat protein
MPPRITLPPVPPEFANDGVAAWSEPMIIETYLPEEPSPYPAFLDSRVYQGSSGRVFPLPFHERISQERVPHAWQAVHLENEWVRLVILPELGGRIYVGYDKVADYDFFYRNNVIKPALVGLAGPWISGGVEFNWPQHHRPGTFLPTDFEIEREDDGAITVWCSDHDPFTRMKGMHGIRLRPDSAAIEARVRLYNRTEETQSFLWWANVAAAANDDYQSFFPVDVDYVADHAKRALATFPRVEGSYYGVNYPERVSTDHPDADRLDWYRNIPVPTSYMVTASRYNFFGGYDHGRQAGFVHWADRAAVPGKKQWTWGNSEFGWAWDRNLTDGDGPYIELMAGAFTDNQPDFSFITPGETKTFSQYWYPIQRIGTVQQATLDAALHLATAATESGVVLEIGVAASRSMSSALIEVCTENGDVLFREETDLAPGRPLVRTIELGPAVDTSVLVARTSVGAQTILEWVRHDSPRGEAPPLATEPADPAQIESNDELFYTGQYLQQYRHATRQPQAYWQTILNRDPHDVRANLALGAACERGHRYADAESHYRSALARLLQRVPNPADGEAHYRMGINLVRQGRDDEAAEYLQKASWNSAWLVPASFALGRLYSRKKLWTKSESALRNALAHDRSHLQATNLLAIVLRERGATAEATSLLTDQTGRDPLDQWTRELLELTITTDAPTLLDVAIEYSSVGRYDDSLRLLNLAIEAARATPVGQVNVGTLAQYHRALTISRMGGDPLDALQVARSSNQRHCLPSRLEDIDALEFGLAADPQDSTAASLLGSWHYSQGDFDVAIELWTRALIAPPGSVTTAVAHRNLGIAHYNIRHDPQAALGHFELARRFAPDDSKLLYEYDQLRLRAGISSPDRRRLLEENSGLVSQRDDLTIVWINLLIESGDSERAEAIIRSRTFQPWEGGEGMVLSAWDAAKVAQFHAALEVGDGETARRHLGEAIDYPESLGEGRHPLSNRAQLQWLLGLSEKALGRNDLAVSAWEDAAKYPGDFLGMSAQRFSDQTYWSIRALLSLGRTEEAHDLTDQLERHALELIDTPARIDFFATSLPSLLIFHDDPSRARHASAQNLLEQVASLRSSPVGQLHQ